MAGDERIREIASVLRPKHPEWLRQIQEVATERRLHEHTRRLDTHDARSSKVEDDITAQYARLSKIEASVAKQDTRVSQIEGDVSIHGSRLSKAEGNIATHDIRFTKGDEDMAGISHKVSQHDLKLDEMSSTLDELPRVSLALAGLVSRIDQLSASQDEIKSKNDKDQAELQATVASLQAALSTLQDTIIRDLEAKVDRLFQKFEASMEAHSQIGKQDLLLQSTISDSLA